MSTCRLCQAPLKPRFTKKVLGKHDVLYFECEGCGSLQTERPYWLVEAYSRSLSSLDTGAAQRNLDNAAATWAVSRCLGARNLLDMGGGDGLLCRLLRDHGLNAYAQDRYATPIYSQGYSEPDFERADLLTAFEVFEHFAEPRDELAGVFSRGPSAILVSTETYQGQDELWWYLTPESGQHVFFYSPRALLDFADTHDYDTRFLGRYTLFTARGSSSAPYRLLRWLLSGKGLKLMRAAMQLRTTSGVSRDFAAQRQRQS